MTKSMKDILSEDQWRELAREIHERFGLNPSITDSEGNVVAGGEFFGNALCRRIKKDPKGVSAICAVAGQFFASELRGDKLPMIDECDAAMTKVAVPVVVDGEFVGSIGCCGALVDDGEVDDFMVAKSLGVDEEELVSVMEDLPRMTMAQAEELRDWLQAKVDAILTAS